jgi:hypothetical protein
MGRKQGVDRKEPGGLAPCSICVAVIDPNPLASPCAERKSSWFLPVSKNGSIVPVTICCMQVSRARGVTYFFGKLFSTSFIIS